MTLTSDIITAAYRESNLIALSASVTTNQQTEALNRLNTLILSTVGNEVGDGLNDLTIGGTYDKSSLCSQWIPANVRLMFNLTAATSFNIAPSPYEGQRLSFVDVANNLATYNVTLTGNGRRIEGATTLVLNTNGDTRQWMYRADTGNWVKITSLIASDQLPFPIEFDDYFITTLALRLNPRYSQILAQETVEALKRSRTQIRARYHNFKQMRSDVETRGGLADPRGFSTQWNSNEFNTGRPWPYL